MAIKQRDAALAAHYRERFEQFARDGEIENPEQYTQAYAEGVDGRQEFHEWDFVKRDGTLLSVNDRYNHPRIHKRYDKGRGAGSREYYAWDDGKSSIATYTITALVYGARITPRAKKVLHERGLEAFTIKAASQEENLNKLQTHHLHGFQGDRDLDNFETGLFICTINFHNAITYFFAKDRTLQEDREKFEKALELEGYDLKNASFAGLVQGTNEKPQSGTPIIHKKETVIWADNSFAKQEMEDPNTALLIRNLYNYWYERALPGQNLLLHLDFGAPEVKGTIYFAVSKPEEEGTDISNDSAETTSEE